MRENGADPDQDPDLGRDVVRTFDRSKCVGPAVTGMIEQSGKEGATGSLQPFCQGRSRIEFTPGCQRTQALETWLAGVQAGETGFQVDPCRPAKQTCIILARQACQRARGWGFAAGITRKILDLHKPPRCAQLEPATLTWKYPVCDRNPRDHGKNGDASRSTPMLWWSRSGGHPMTAMPLPVVGD